MGLINCLTCREDFGEKEQEEEYYRQLNQKAADSHELRRRFQEKKDKRGNLIHTFMIGLSHGVASCL